MLSEHMESNENDQHFEFRAFMELKNLLNIRNDSLHVRFVTGTASCIYSSDRLDELRGSTSNT